MNPLDFLLLTLIQLLKNVKQLLQITPDEVIQYWKTNKRTHSVEFRKAERNKFTSEDTYQAVIKLQSTVHSFIEKALDDIYYLQFKLQKGSPSATSEISKFKQALYQVTSIVLLKICRSDSSVS
jgi:hypothetical protein